MAKQKQIKPIHRDHPLPPATSSYYASEEDTEAYEKTISDVMRREKVSRERAQQIIDTQ